MSHSDQAAGNGSSVIHLAASGPLSHKIRRARKALEDGSFGASSDASLRRQVKSFQGDVETLTQNIAKLLEYSRTLRTRPDVKQLLQESQTTRQRKVSSQRCWRKFACAYSTARWAQYLGAFLESTKADIRCLHLLLSKHVLIPGKEEAQRQEEARRADVIAAAGASGDIAAAAAAFPYQVGAQEVFNPIRQWAAFTLQLEQQLQAVSVESTSPGQFGSPGGLHPSAPAAPAVRHTATSAARVSAQYQQASRAELPSLTAVASQTGGASLGAPRVRHAVSSAAMGRQMLLQPSKRVAALRTAGNRTRLLKVSSMSNTAHNQSQSARDEVLLARMRESTALLPAERLSAGLGAEAPSGGTGSSIAFDFSAITQLVALKEHLTVEVCRFLQVRKGELLRALSMNAGGSGGGGGEAAAASSSNPQHASGSSIGVKNDVSAPHRRTNRLAYRGVDTPAAVVQGTIQQLLEQQAVPSTTHIVRAHSSVQQAVSHNASAGTRRFMSLASSFLDLEALLRRARLTASLTNESGADMDSVLEMQAELRETKRQLQQTRAANTELQAQLSLLRGSLGAMRVPHARGSHTTSSNSAPAEMDSGAPYGGLLQPKLSPDRQVEFTGPTPASAAVASTSASQLFTLGVRLDEAMLRLRSCNDELLATHDREAALQSQVGMLRDANTSLHDKLVDATRELAVTNTWYKPRLEALEGEVASVQQAARDARAAVDVMGGRFAEVLDAKAGLETQLAAISRERDTMAQRLHESIKQLHSVKVGEVARLHAVIAQLQASRELLQGELRDTMLPKTLSQTGKNQ